MKTLDTLKLRPRTKIETAAPADTDKKRKLDQIRKKKSQLRKKKADFNERLEQDLHQLRGQELKIKYGNKPRPKPKTPKVTPKKPKKKYPS